MAEGQECLLFERADFNKPSVVCEECQSSIISWGCSEPQYSRSDRWTIWDPTQNALHISLGLISILLTPPPPLPPHPPRHPQTYYEDKTDSLYPSLCKGLGLSGQHHLCSRGHKRFLVKYLFGLVHNHESLFFAKTFVGLWSSEILVSSIFQM